MIHASPRFAALDSPAARQAITAYTVGSVHEPPARYGHPPSAFCSATSDAAASWPVGAGAITRLLPRVGISENMFPRGPDSWLDHRQARRLRRRASSITSVTPAPN